MMTRQLSLVHACLFGAISFAAITNSANACSRILFRGDGNLVITGRTMDWMEDIQSNVWLFPRGMERNGAAGPNSLSWTSQFGSVVLSVYDKGTTDGMNETGLVVNALYLSESDYGTPDRTRPLMAVTAWAQYVLDNFGSVNDAISTLQSETFNLVAPTLPNGSPAVAHLALSDPTGDSAVLEYVDGKLTIHFGQEFRVMTNSPNFERQLAINSYWKEIGGSNFMPGTIDSPDRFVRASYLLGALPTKADPKFISAIPNGNFDRQAAAGVLGVLRSVSVPLGFSDPARPNVATTLWRTMYDQKNMVMYFDSATTMCSFWLPMAELDFKPGAPVRKLTLTGGRSITGNATGNFENARPFAFLGTSP